ncbi:DUF397 domain-containing protein [Streptomyces sp. NPDC094448]|uniref:DUF397 domain-containing protein n=1 Tax=Streptomyces sp. NPDC094448 TaxID=3366063 RepID=UPI00382BC06E
MNKSRPVLLAKDFPGVKWRKASASAGEGNCVEVAECSASGIDLNGVIVRDSKNATGPVLLFDSVAFSAFIAGFAQTDCCSVPRS